MDTIKAVIIKNTCRTLKLPLLVRYIVFSFICLNRELKENLRAMFSPLIPKLEILDVLTLFSIIPDFTVMPF